MNLSHSRKSPAGSIPDVAPKQLRSKAPQMVCNILQLMLTLDWTEHAISVELHHTKDRKLRFTVQGNHFLVVAKEIQVRQPDYGLTCGTQLKLHGTTIVGMILDQGYILGSDSLVAGGRDGQFFISTRTAHKIINIGNAIQLGQSGLLDQLRVVRFSLFEEIDRITQGGGEATVQELAKFGYRCCRECGLLSVELVFAAFERGVPRMSYCNAAGWYMVTDCVAIGSGAMFAFPFLKKRHTEGISGAREGRDVTRRSLLRASDIDIHTGGFARVYIRFRDLHEDTSISFAELEEMCGIW